MVVTDILLLTPVLVLYAAIAAILVRQYLRTRNPGFVWLGVAVLLWPGISRLLETGEKVFIDRAVRHQSVFYPFTLIAHGRITTGRLLISVAAFEKLIGLSLLLVAVLYLSRAKKSSTRQLA